MLPTGFLVISLTAHPMSIGVECRGSGASARLVRLRCSSYFSQSHRPRFICRRLAAHHTQYSVLLRLVIRELVFDNLAIRRILKRKLCEA